MKKIIKHRLRQFILLFFFIGNVGMLAAQSQRVTIELKNATLKELFSIVEKQTSYRFAYRNVVLDESNDVSISVKNKSVPEVLDEVFKNKGLDYNIVSDKSIVVFDKRPNLGKSSREQVTVKGIVYDETEVPVIGANIVVKGANVGTVSNIDGKFSINAPADGVLEVSYVGYNKEEVEINGRTSLRIDIRPVVLDEVVVVAYGTQKKSSVTGAIDVISSKTIEQVPVSNIAYSLQGTVPGLIITDNGGKPGIYSFAEYSCNRNYEFYRTIGYYRWCSGWTRGLLCIELHGCGIRFCFERCFFCSYLWIEEHPMAFYW